MSQLSRQQLYDNAVRFAKEWQKETNERAESQSFWNEFFEVFGLRRRRVAQFEASVKRFSGTGKVDVFWRGVLLAEHKSAGKDLNDAFEQAMAYYNGLKNRQDNSILPRHIIICDFKTFEIYDLKRKNKKWSFPLEELCDNLNLFGFMTEYGDREVLTEEEEIAVNVAAAEMMGKLHEELLKNGYPPKDLEIFLVRLLFCFFADDTGIFERGIFREYLFEHTNPSGSDTGCHLGDIFDVLNTLPEERQKNLPEDLKAFPFVNGGLFTDVLRPARFDFSMRNLLMDAAAMDWSQISPAIFGSMFQSAMNEADRRNLGAHYTSEGNILKLTGPLFMDELRAEFEAIRGQKTKLDEFHDRIANLTFLDPACGCGNFLIVAYRELRLLELDVLCARHPEGKRKELKVNTLSKIDVYQFWGMEVEEFPARIAQVALWLTDHQMNRRLSDEFGEYYVRIPLKSYPNILHTNALQTDWLTLLPDFGGKPQYFDYILGNPPFIGSKMMADRQRKELLAVFQSTEGAGVLDYVSAWYMKAVQYMAASQSSGHQTRSAFVSTNSIAQGEQVAILWRHLRRQQAIHLHFAHRTFKWSNEGRGVAAVYCVIIGFGPQGLPTKRLFSYTDVRDETPTEAVVSSINPYLVEGPFAFIEKRNKPLCDVPQMNKGSQPTDNGNFLFTEEEKDAFIRFEPAAAPFFRQFVGANEFINGEWRWCLWLKDAQPNELRKLPNVLKRIEQVKKFRLQSTKPATVKKAQTPALFDEDRQPDSPYLIIPSVSSERREYIPIGFLEPTVIVSNLALFIPNADNYLFGILTSTMHMAWMRYTCGRLENRYRYSNTIVYNNFPFPQEVPDKQRAKVAAAAQTVLDTRKQYPNSSLADLYDPNTMPAPLLKAHQALDKAVDACYRPSGFASENERIAWLFDLYGKLTQ